MSAASEEGAVDVVEVLLSAGSCPNGTDCPNTPLFVTCSHENESIVKLLLNHGADPNILRECWSDSDDFSLPVLCLACRSGHLEIVRLLLNAGADVNISFIRDLSNNSKTPLQYALNAVDSENFNGNPDRLKIINLLLDYKANVSANIDDKKTPLYYASLLGLKEIVLKILDLIQCSTVGTEPQLLQENLDDALLIACERQHLDTSAALLSHGANPDFISNSVADDDREAWTSPLCLAAWNTDLKMINLLLQHGANPNLGKKSQLSIELCNPCSKKSR